MDGDTTKPTPDHRYAGATMRPILGAVRVNLPTDVTLDIVTSVARMCVDDSDGLEQLIALGSAAEARESHDIRQLVGQDELDNRVYEAQAPFREMRGEWDVPLSDARRLGVRLLNMWHQAPDPRSDDPAPSADPALMSGDEVTEYLRSHNWTPGAEYNCGCRPTALCSWHAERRAIDHYHGRSA